MQLQIRRHLVQLCATILYNANAFSEITGKRYNLGTYKVCVPGLNCQYCSYSVSACPLGITQNALGSGVSSIAVRIWGMLVLVGLLFGRLICGWACPMGFFQDLLAKVPFPKIKKNAITHYLSYVKYGVAAIFVVGIPFYTGRFGTRGIAAFCSKLCMGTFLEGFLIPTFLNGEVERVVNALKDTHYLLLFIFMLTMFFIYRPFCRFICPLGVFYGFFNKFSLLGMKVDAGKCVNCYACVRTCKMDIKKVGDQECIGCGQCISKCPTKAISYKKLPFGQKS